MKHQVTRNPSNMSRNAKAKAKAPAGQDAGNDSIPFTSEYSLEPSRIMDLFTAVFQHILVAEDLQAFIQEVKGQLYEREYLSAFDTDDKRFAYASRWTPSRALAYSSLFASLEPIRNFLAQPEAVKNVLCVGGGAASEVVGLAAVFGRLKEFCPSSSSQLNLQIIDIADWSTVLDYLSNYMKQNWFYKPEKLATSFHQNDVLSESSIDYTQLDLVTLLFTTNELFAEKRPETVKYLQKLNSQCKSGSYLLIAESAGSYSNITIGTKKFPVQFLIDTILLGRSGDGPWQLCAASDSCWYRINEKEIDYPMKLENMRFFYRLYRKNIDQTN